MPVLEYEDLTRGEFESVQEIDDEGAVCAGMGGARGTVGEDPRMML
jgi:hypothetical protein